MQHPPKLLKDIAHDIVENIDIDMDPHQWLHEFSEPHLLMTEEDAAQWRNDYDLPYLPMAQFVMDSQLKEFGNAQNLDITDKRLMTFHYTVGVYEYIIASSGQATSVDIRKALRKRLGIK